MRRESWAWLGFGLAMCFMGSSVVASKWATTRFPLALAVELRLAVAILALLPFLLPARDESQRLTKRSGWTLFWQAATGVFGFNLCLLYGLQHTTAADSSIVTGTQPAVTALLGWLLLREQVRSGDWLKVLLATVGVITIGSNAYLQPGTAGPAANWGNLFVFLAIVCEGLFTILGKRTPPAISPLRRTAWLCFFSFLLFLPFAVWEARSFDWSAITAIDWGVILYLGLFVTVVAYFLFYNSIPYISTHTAALLGGLIPASALLLSGIVLNEEVTWIHLVGLGLILLSLVPNGLGQKYRHGLKNLRDISNQIRG